MTPVAYGPAGNTRSGPLATEAGVSLGQGFNVKKLLVDREWMETGDDGVLCGAETKSDARVTSPVQTYLDLRQIKGRGEEAAGFLKQQGIDRGRLGDRVGGQVLT